jgi:ATP-binding cassette subfamily B protein
MAICRRKLHQSDERYFVSFLSAKLVLSGNLTLGMMLSVQYIIGQLNSLLLQLIDFINRLRMPKFP